MSTYFSLSLSLSLSLSPSLSLSVYINMCDGLNLLDRNHHVLPPTPPAITGRGSRATPRRSWEGSRAAPFAFSYQ